MAMKQENQQPALSQDVKLASQKDVKDVLQEHGTTIKGLSAAEVESRRTTYGANVIVKEKEMSIVLEFLSYFKSPLIIILLIASTISATFGEMRNAIIIWIMILLSVV